MEKISIRIAGELQDAVNLVPSLEGDLALVNLSVVQRLARLLPTADFETIRKNFIRDLNHPVVENLKDMVELLEEELAFHKTVNLITTIEKEQVEKIEEPQLS